MRKSRDGKKEGENNQEAIPLRATAKEDQGKEYDKQTKGYHKTRREKNEK